MTSHPLFGPLFETAMAGELIKQGGVLPIRPVMHHWRSAGGAEVDIVLERDGKLHPFEIKLTTRPSRRMAKGIEAFQAAHAHLKCRRGIIICAADKTHWITDSVLAVPWNLL